ncbi:Rne/Rng family ribonuclease [bacterium DOLJORAL78_65_58]|nr:MAG: Rne/Rng family ribonuclease [bacterium DOLZORAL124_64_63]PIE75997.1 MAG: Rne/Rng family ribonuclease [bacterium DOLJORAL78_65_58]
MKKEIIINSSLHEVRVAMLEDGEVVELLVERADSKRIVGNVYKGKVTSVKPGLQAAFVDIGLERAGFLHASDLDHDDEETEGGRRNRNRHVPDIGTVLKAGDDIIVQVTKEPISTKGPRLTADISLPGRYLVMMPKGRHVGVSRKIEDRKERTRLKQLLQGCRPEQGAFIIRTAATSASDKAIEADVAYLSNLFSVIDENNRTHAAPALIHEDVGMVVGLIRDIFKEDTSRLVIDDKDDYSRLLAYVKNFAPELKDKIQLYKGSLPIFDSFEIEAEIKKTLDKRVWMKKGGYLIIEQTEALVSIDVNTGRFTGRRNQEETILQTNLLAAKEVARQLRLRDLGGIIVIDFIDMDSEGNRKRLFNELRTHLKRDRARHKVFQVSGLGLVEMSRQRVRPSLESQLSNDCPYCTGVGKVLSMETMSSKIERLIHRIAIVTKEKHLQIQANPVLALYLLEERPEQFRELCRSFAIEVNVLDDPTLHVEDFRVVSLDSGKDLIAEFEKKTRRR